MEKAIKLKKEVEKSKLKKQEKNNINNTSNSENKQNVNSNKSKNNSTIDFNKYVSLQKTNKNSMQVYIYKN
jgi:hypothetical protein